MVQRKPSTFKLWWLLNDEYTEQYRDALYDNVCSATVVPASAPRLARGDAEVDS